MRGEPIYLRQAGPLNDAKCISTKWQRNLENPEPNPRSGLAMSDFPPSATMVSAARQIDRAPSGNVSNSFRAALIQETDAFDEV